ncbi:GCD7 [Candida oxycetoniae]|uniref:Translation initiation factor eIF2B subunit beta n=1 Tax=Candida oxycetoniae TaxID=497107 RepID=A0AAI9WZS9_9ASCO|nr:GCD7 [Candida oxycetoniae]KAI3406731.2 GCD7 [Candida oxycetoniae]
MSALTPEIQSLLDTVVFSLKRHQIDDEKEMALTIAHMLMKVISAARWSSTYELISLIRSVGTVIHKAYPRRVVPGNIIRRVLALIREEIETTDGESNNVPMMSSMFSLLTTTNKQEAKADKTSQTKKQNSDMRSIIIQGIRDLVDEITNVNEGIEIMSADLIHDNEVLLTPTPTSDTVLHFLLKAKSKRKFTVLVTENFPNNLKRAQLFAKKLAEHDIETILIPDSTTYAVMSRVGKVIIGSNTVFANGGCLSSSGVASVVECAKEHKTPVFAVAGLYKLSPLYPFTRNDLIEVGNSGKVLSHDDFELVDNVDVTNPLEDYIPPEHIDIFITNIGGFAPSFIYRIVLDNYKTEDNKLD